MQNEILALFNEAMADRKATRQQFSTLLRTDVNAHPLPFFGDPVTARFATIGVNPSASEFTWSRWPKADLSTEELAQRALGYFKNCNVSAHPWFDGYEMTLNLLGHSYKTDAVHLDLSPRATKSMRTVAKVDFLAMIDRDLKWFLRSLDLCKNLQAVIVSGSVTGTYYFDEFLRAKLPEPYKFTLETRFGVKKRGATALYKMTGPNLSVPVLFCCKSPSGDKGVFLKSEVNRLRPELVEAGFEGVHYSSS